MSDKYNEVKNNFLAGRIEGCACYFEKHNYLLEAGYCNIIEGHLDKAKSLLEKIITINPRAHWGLLIIQILEGQIPENPTYFEIRNFLEIDMNIFISYYRGDYVEKIIKFADFLAYYNLECYKYIGRVFWANNLMPAAMFFLNKAKDKFYNDPELHYLLAYIYFNENKNDECKKALNACLNILPEYAPAIKLSEMISG